MPPPTSCPTHRAALIDSYNLDAEVLVHPLHHHDVVSGLHQVEACRGADRVLQKLLPVGGGGGQEGEQAAADE